jgi:hypothetical protein
MKMGSCSPRSEQEPIVFLREDRGYGLHLICVLADLETVMHFSYSCLVRTMG